MSEEPSEERMVRIHVTLNSQSAVCGGETMWALPLDEDGLYEVRNSPYFTYGIHVHDIVRCELVDDQREVKEVVRPSGWSTVRIVFKRGVDLEAMNNVVKKLVELGGHPDLGFPGFLSLAVPPDVDSEPIVEHLDLLSETEMLAFETAEQRIEGSFDGLDEDEDE